MSSVLVQNIIPAILLRPDVRQIRFIDLCYYGSGDNLAGFTWPGPQLPPVVSLFERTLLGAELDLTLGRSRCERSLGGFWQTAHTQTELSGRNSIRKENFSKLTPLNAAVAAMLRQVVTAEELNQRLQRSRLVVVLFTAEWNNRTEEMRQLIEEMAVQFKTVAFVEASRNLTSKPF